MLLAATYALPYRDRSRYSINSNIALTETRKSCMFHQFVTSGIKHTGVLAFEGCLQDAGDTVK